METTDSKPPSACRVPAEWEPLEAVYLAWPHSLDTWPGHFASIPGFYARWARQIAESTPVRMLAGPDVLADCQAALSGAANVEILDIPTNDAWIRDYGPTFVVDEGSGRLHAVDWQYNSWGGKYPPWDLDNAVASKLCRHLGLPRIQGKLCLEGGALEVDGGGRLLTTPECLINDTRNPGWEQQSIARELHRRLGVTEILWLDGGGLVGDDTDGHIDQLARFIDRQNVVAAVADDPADENHRPLEENYRQLRLWGSSTTPRVQVHRLPIPPARHVSGQRVPESYCNFLRLGPERLLVPTFAAPTDDHALGLLRELSGVQVEGIDCRDLIWGLGALHCASRDQPGASRDQPRGLSRTTGSGPD